MQECKIVIVNNYPHENNHQGSKFKLNHWKTRETSFFKVFASYSQILQGEMIKLYVKEVHFTEMENTSNLSILNEADGVIFSGSSLNISELIDGDGYKQYFDKLEDFIVHATMPLLGICFGHQLIGHAFGFRIGKYTTIDGSYGEKNKIGILQVDPSYDLLTRFMSSNVHLLQLCVAWSHEEEIKRKQRDDGEDNSHSACFDEVFKIYASTPVCEIQVIKHLHRPIFGVQFHPETDSQIVINGIGSAKEHGIRLLHGFLDFVVQNARTI